MNEIKIYLNPSGSTAELYKDFNLYQYCYRKVQITLYVPTAILYENADGTFLNAVKTGAILTAPNGARVTTKSFNAEYVKTITINGVEYAVYTQLMPKEYALYAGTETIVCNVFNIDNTNSSTPKIISVTTSQVVPLTVLESAYLDTDEPLDPTEAEVIEGLINSLNKRLDNGEYATKALYPWSSDYTYGVDEIVSYPNRGEHGVLLKSLVENNTETPYNNGVLNSAYWEEVTDFNVLNGLYGLQTELEEAAKSAQDNATAAGQSASSAESAAQTATSAAERLDGAATYIEEVKSGTVAVPKAVSDENGENIANQFASVNSDIEGLREDITNEAHFRGYLETNAEIQALSGTPNDYAYSAQSGTVWIYQTATGWTDSGKPVPDQVIPKGTATPLMDGTAQVGNSNTYADALHRHPTDTTRASTAVATQTSNGLMSAADKTKLDGLGTGNVTGVKGNAESAYRTGNVNITPANVGAVNKAGDTMTGILTVPRLDSNTIATRTADYLEIILSDGTVFGITGGNADIYSLRSMRNNIANAYSPENRPKAALYGWEEDWPYTYEINQVDTVERYFLSSDGNTWYRVWSSGWKEMGGSVGRDGIVNGLSSVVLPSPFDTVTYTLQITSRRTNSTTTSTSIRELGYATKTNSQFTVYRSSTAGYDAGFDWYACGF